MEEIKPAPLYKQLLEGKPISPSKEKFYLNTLKRRMEFLTGRINNRKEQIKGRYDHDSAERNALAFLLGKKNNFNN